MLLSEKISMLYKSEILRLNWQGSTVGLRVKMFNVNTDKFDYYDFSIKYVTSSQVREFLSRQKFKIDELYEHNGVLMTKDEIQSSYIVKEFKSEDEALDILIPLVKLYNMKKEVA